MCSRMENNRDHNTCTNVDIARVDSADGIAGETDISCTVNFLSIVLRAQTKNCKILYVVTYFYI